MINLPGVIFSLLSAMSFGLTNAANRRGVLSTSASMAMYSSVFIGVPIFLGIALANGEMAQAGDLSVEQYLWLMASGVVHFIMGRYCNYRAIGAIGSNRSQPLSASNLMYTLALSMLFLGEHPTLHAMAGTVLLILGPIAAIPRRRAVAVFAGAAPAHGGGPELPPGRLVEGYGFGVLAAMCYGSSPVLIRLGLGSTGLSVLGAAVSCSAAGAMLAVSLLRPGQIGTLRRDIPVSGWFRDLRGRFGWDTPFTWLAVGGVAITVSQLFRYLAVGAMDVSLSSPLISLAGVFSVFWSFVLNRRLESFSPNVLLGIGLSIIGSVVLIAPIGP